MKEILKEQVITNKLKKDNKVNSEGEYKKYIRDNSEKFANDLLESEKNKRQKILFYRVELDKQKHQNVEYKKKFIMSEIEQQINKSLLTEVSKMDSNAN